MTATSRQRAVREDHLRNHERLLEAAITLFDEEGPTAPLHRIAKRAGVSEASLYRHFSGRDELVYRVYDRHATMLEEVAVDALEQHAAKAAGVRLEQLCTALITTMVRHPSYTALTLWALRTPPPQSHRRGLCKRGESARSELSRRRGARNRHHPRRHHRPHRHGRLDRATTATHGRWLVAPTARNWSERVHPSGGKGGRADGGRTRKLDKSLTLSVELPSSRDGASLGQPHGEMNEEPWVNCTPRSRAS